MSTTSLSELELAPEHHPQGAFVDRQGRGLWRVWAPYAERVALVTWRGGERSEKEMEPHGFGYFEAREENVEEGLRYAYKLVGGEERPDPATRWQPDGVHRPSAVFVPENFAWSDESWKGLPRKDLVIYELHVGTFTPEGTFDAVIPRLAELAELGITAIEIMPVAQFAGERNWGYDGVHPFAAQNSYGGPRGLQRLVDAAHARGLAVFMDVVYNHLGPEGNYLHEFGPYFTDHYHTPWGLAVNYDARDCDPVRRFVSDNACMWVRDFHVDGLRLDATHAIYDLSAHHILAQLQEEVQAEAKRLGRTVHVVSETNQNDVRIIHPPERGGYGLDGVWSDDFHHAVHAALTGERDGYFRDFGHPRQIAKAFNDAFVYDGCYSPYRRRRYGSKVGDLERTHFVVCLKNHDQVGNRAMGDRPATYLPPEAIRLSCGLLMLSPFVPLIFQGEEYGETRPFPFFCSFGDEHLIEAVRNGRREEFANLDFEWGAEIPDPQDPATFESAKLSWEFAEGTREGQLRALYRDLLRARREWPALRDHRNTRARVVEVGTEGIGGPGVFVVERGGEKGVVACGNLSSEPLPLPPLERGERGMVLSSEFSRYGGARDVEQEPDGLYPYELIVFGPKECRL